MEYHSGFEEDQRYQISCILYEAFATKLKPLFSSRERGISYIAEFIRRDRVITAVDRGTVVGVAGMKYGGHDFIDGSLRGIIRVLGLGIFRVLAFSWVLDQPVDDDTLMMESLAVSSAMRGQGIGSKLIEEVYKRASDEGCRKVQLHVVDWNEAARRLYERKGFIVTDEKSLFYPFSEVFGFKKAYEMTYNLD